MALFMPTAMPISILSHSQRFSIPRGVHIDRSTGIAVGCELAIRLVTHDGLHDCEGEAHLSHVVTATRQLVHQPLGCALLIAGRHGSVLVVDSRNVYRLLHRLIEEQGVEKNLNFTGLKAKR